MFFFRKSKDDVVTDLSWLRTDIHSHLLPGIDDGAPDIVISIELIKGLQALGFEQIITTPHVLWDVYPNNTGRIQAKKEDVKGAIREAGIKITFNAAAEYFIDEHFVQSLKEKQPLLTLQQNLVLVEFSMITAPMDLLDVLFQMQLQGYQPLIAHPERYIYLQNRKVFFDQLKNSGCQFQLNLLSLTPHYGTAVQSLAEYLLKHELYDYAGTDLHGEKHLQALHRLGASPLYARLKDSGQVKNHLL
jgi:tyrosine-protein phosphatase YwqE